MKNKEILLYSQNTISQQLFMLYLLGNTVFTIFFANTADVDADLGLFIILNIVLSLLGFLTAVRQRVYAKFWGYVGFAIGVFQLVRLMWIPEEIVNPLRLLLVVLLLVSGALAITASLLCLRRTTDREHYIRENDVDLSILQQ
ncbi:MAG: hypothetical protein Phog2KO_33900 [Phototrophicaceae bacterium]